ncbi:MAG: SMP-30/gluconolactonase/LRE family protein [Hyphomicrobium sp.]|nr:SMP-30/gluconolactonase/LRE family protein [Hyphomicrobium sp.]
MRRSVRNVALICAAGLALGLSGCGESSTPEKKAEAEAPAATTDAAAPADAAKSATPDATLTQLWELDGLSTPESALPDKAANIMYVSNVAGGPMDKDGNGFISKVTFDGKIDTLEWVKGLNAPKGLAQAKGKLYAADIDQLVEIDIAKGEVTARYDAAGGKFLNDAAADSEGRIYVSDMLTNTIWRLDGGKFEKWVEDPALISPNGLLVQGDKLLVGGWGVMTDGFATKVPGHMLQVSLADKKISALGDATPVGNLDGLEPEGNGKYLVTDWMAGKLYRIDASGKSETLLQDLGQGSADIGYDPDTKTLYIPLMNQNKLRAYKVN